MIPALFATAVLVTGGVLLGRRVVRRARERAWHRQPGRSPQTAIPIERMDRIDEVLAKTRCHCGGTVVPLSEGTLSRPEGTLRVAHAECLRCEADLHLYFDLSELRH